MITLTLTGAAIFGGIVALGWLKSMITIVDQKSETVIESFGKYSHTKTNPGLHLKWPAPFQTVAQKVSTKVQQYREDLRTKSKDDVFVQVPIEMQLRVTNTQKYVYETNNPVGQISTIISAAVKEQASKMDFAELYEAREEISDKVKASVGQQITDTYGVEIVDIIVDEPKAPEAIERSYNEVRASERELTATNNRSEAEKIRMVKEAEGRRAAAALLGKGIAEQRAAIFENYSEQFNKLIEQGMNKEAAEKIMALAMIQDTQRDIGEKGNLIITSGNGSSQLAELMALGKVLGENAPNPKPRTKNANDDKPAAPRSNAPGK